MSNVDWNKAPEDATHCIYGSIFYKVCNGTMMKYNQSERLWKLSEYKGVAELSEEYTVIERPKQEEVDMNKQVFKVGDKVYCPALSPDIFTVAPVFKACSKYPLVVYFATKMSLFTVDGKIHLDGVLQSVFHATPENKALLDQLYRTEFEAPPVNLSGSDLTRAKLKETGKLILCLASDGSDENAMSSNRVVLIAKYTGRFIEPSGVEWKYAVPYTGDEFLTGKDFE